MPHDLIIMPRERPLSGSVPAPPDEDLGHLALVVAALADGTSELRRLSTGKHVAALIAALRGLGVVIEASGAREPVRVEGRGLRGWIDSEKPVWCADSAPTLRRLAAALVAHPFQSRLTVESTAPLPAMPAIAGALRRRGGQIEGVFAGSNAGDLASPFTVGPLALDRALSGVEEELVAPRPDVKEALLWSGLYADEATYVREHVVTRDHLERLLQALDVPITAAGPIVALDPEPWKGSIDAFSFDVPGDVAASSLLASLATLVPASRVCVREVGLNSTRLGLFDLLRQMGGDVELSVQATRLGESEGTVCASHASLRGVTMAEEPLLRAGDDWPVLVALAARARGTTELALLDALGDPGAFVQTKGSAADVVDLLRAFGVAAHAIDDGGLVVVGRPEGPLDAVDIDAEGDAARATTALILAHVAHGTSRIRGADALAARFPRLVGTLRALGSDVRIEPRDV